MDWVNLQAGLGWVGSGWIGLKFFAVWWVGLGSWQVAINEDFYLISVWSVKYSLS